MARREADARAPHLRLRGKLGRYGFDVKSYDVGEAQRDRRLRAGLPGERAGAVDAAPRARASRARRARTRSCPTRCRRSSSCRCARDALAALHFPRRRARRPRLARRRLALDELIALQLVVARSRTTDAVAASLDEPGELSSRYRAVLPFALTAHQETAILEIDADLAQTAPMQRLLQGDVGSGKTVVALYALLRAVENGRQGALMAPTETLAEQHFLTLEPLCAQLGVRCVLLTGSVGSKKIRDEIANGDAQIVVGTHALIQRDVEFADLAVAVVDEQHRFGVEQRTGTRRRPLAARAAHDGDADPAHARADDLRRPRRSARSRSRPRTASRSSRRGSVPSGRARRTRVCACISTRAGRRTSSAR